MDNYNDNRNPRPIRMQALSGSPELLAKVPKQPPQGVFPAGAQGSYAARSGAQPAGRQFGGAARQSFSGGRSGRKRRRFNAPRLIVSSLIAVAVIGVGLLFALPAGREAVGGLFAGLGGGAGDLGGSGGFASNGSSTFKGHTVMPMDGSDLFFFNSGFYVYQLKGENLTEYLGGQKDMGSNSDDSENAVRFGKNVFWLSGRIPTYSSADDPHAIQELDFEASVMTYDEKNIYLLDKEEGKLYTLNPSSLETTSVDMPYNLNNTSTSIQYDRAYAVAMDGMVYFTGTAEGGDDACTYVIDSATGECEELLPGHEGVLAGLCVDKSGFYFKGEDAVYRLPRGGDAPEEIFAYDDPRLEEAWNDTVSAPDSLYLDGGYLYLSFLRSMPDGYGMYRIRPDGSGLTAINLPEEYLNYISSSDGVVVKNGWINYNTGALHLGKDGIDKEIYNDHPGYHYRKADIPYTDMGSGGAARQAQGGRDASSGAEEDASGAEAEGDASDDGGAGGGLLDGLFGGGSGGLSGKYVTEVTRNRTLEFDNGVLHLYENGMKMDLDYTVSGDQITFSRQSDDLQGMYDQTATLYEETGGVINDDGSLLIGTITYTKE